MGQYVSRNHHAKKTKNTPRYSKWRRESKWDPWLERPTLPGLPGTFLALALRIPDKLGWLVILLMEDVPCPGIWLPFVIWTEWWALNGLPGDELTPTVTPLAPALSVLGQSVWMRFTGGTALATCMLIGWHLRTPCQTSVLFTRGQRTT